MHLLEQLIFVCSVHTVFLFRFVKELAVRHVGDIDKMASDQKILNEALDHAYPPPRIKKATNADDGTVIVGVDGGYKNNKRTEYETPPSLRSSSSETRIWLDVLSPSKFPNGFRYFASDVLQNPQRIQGPSSGVRFPTDTSTFALVHANWIPSNSLKKVFLKAHGLWWLPVSSEEEEEELRGEEDQKIFQKHRELFGWNRTQMFFL